MGGDTDTDVRCADEAWATRVRAEEALARTLPLPVQQELAHHLRVDVSEEPIRLVCGHCEATATISGDARPPEMARGLGDFLTRHRDCVPPRVV